VITKDPTTPQMHRYTTLWNISIQKLTLIFHKAVQRSTWGVYVCLTGTVKEFAIQW